MSSKRLLLLGKEKRRQAPRRTPVSAMYTQDSRSQIILLCGPSSSKQMNKVKDRGSFFTEGTGAM